MARDYSLGIDIGTTKVAAVIADPSRRSILESTSLDHNAGVVNLKVPGSSEQSVEALFTAVTKAVSQLSSHARENVGAVGVTGQMHGVVLFNAEERGHSHLVTWQDARCNSGSFLSDLQSLTGERSLRSGFGVSTLVWCKHYEPDVLHEYRSASTIHGYLATSMCGCQGGMDPSDAASFGLFDILSCRWKEDLIRRCGLDPQMLPQIVKAPRIFGRVGCDWASRLGLPQGVPVIVPIGDNQASLYGSLSDPDTQIALTIGTGAQVSVVLAENPRQLPEEGSTFEIRPYIDDRYIAVGASLGGGRTLAALSTALQDFLRGLGLNPLPDPGQIYSVLQSLAESRAETTLRADPSFAGERYNPDLRGSLTAVSFENFTLGDIFASLSRGIVDALRQMLPAEMYCGRREVIGSGNAIRRSVLMQRYIEQLFGVCLVVTPGGETTCAGAAFLAGRVL